MSHSYLFPAYAMRVLGLGLGLALLFAVACGAAATATPRPAATVAPAATAVPAATPTRAATAAPAAAVPTGKVILAQSDWGNELFSDHDTRGEGSLYQKYLHDYFVWGKEGKELVPGIAKSWSFTPDGLTWTFEVRTGVKFHNGDTLTAEDAAYSLDQEFGERAKEQAVDPTVVRQAKDIAAPFAAAGPTTVTMTTGKPQMYIPFTLSEMAPGPFGTIFSKAYRESVGRDGYNVNPDPGTTGPFNLVRHEKGSLMRFERWDGYWALDQRNHRFQTLELRLIPELSTRVAALRAGEADIIEANVEVMDQIEAAGGQIIWGPEALYAYFTSEGCFPGEDLPVPCDKKEFRQALDYALDKEFIAREIYGEEMAMVKGWSHVGPSSLGYEPDLDPFPYDPDKARELLAQAGCPNAECFPDPYILYTWEAGELPFMPDVAQLVCQMWEDTFGINCEVEVGDSVSLKDKIHSLSLAGNYLVRPNEDRFDGGSIMFGGYGGPEPYVLRVPELTEAVNKALGLIGTMEERHQAYHEMYVIAREQHGNWALFHINTPWGVGPKIKDWKPWAMVPNVTATWTIELK